MTHDFSTFFTLMTDEICSARKQHSPIHSLHEGYDVILEEMDELKEQVWKKAAARDHKNILEELVQIAAMAARMAVDCSLLPKFPGYPAPEGSATYSYTKGLEKDDVQIQGSTPLPADDRGFTLGYAALFVDAT